MEKNIGWCQEGVREKYSAELMFAKRNGTQEIWDLHVNHLELLLKSAYFLPTPNAFLII